MFIRPKQTIRISFAEFVEQYDQVIDDLSKGKAFTVFTAEHEITLHKHPLLKGAYFISDDNELRGYNEAHDVHRLLKKVKRALNVTSEVEKKQQALSDELNLADLQQACLEKLGLTQETNVYTDTLRTIFIGEDHFYEEDKTETVSPDALNTNVNKQHRSVDNHVYQIAHAYIEPETQHPALIAHTYIELEPKKQHPAKPSLYRQFVPRLVGEFVTTVLKELETLPKPLSEVEMKNLYTLFVQRKNIDPTLMDRSNYPTELVKLLNQHKDSKLKTTFENLTPFIDCLSDWFKAIKVDERAYSKTPNSVADRAYNILAKKLAETLNKFTYETLMPEMVTEELVEASRHYSKK